MLRLMRRVDALDQKKPGFEPCPCPSASLPLCLSPLDVWRDRMVKPSTRTAVVRGPET